MDYLQERQVAINIAKEAGKIILQYFEDNQSVEMKTDNTPVTIADKLINSLVIERLAKEFPNDGVIGEEESTSKYGLGRKWICDPIDGTAGYIWGTPTALFSLGFVIDGKPILGIVYDPYLNRMYVGEKGKQSECNGKPIVVSKLNLDEGYLGVSGSLKNLAKYTHFKKLLDDKVKLATFSGFVYKGCLVARGKLIGHIELGANAHDVVAIHVIVEGAGGKVTAPDGTELTYLKPFKGCIISNGLIHEKLIEYCKEDVIK